MSNNENSVKNLLKTYGIYNSELAAINFHLNVFECDATYLIKRLSKNGIMVSAKNLTKEELAHTIGELISKCDMKNPEYDSKLDEEMTRIGLRTDQFDCGHKCSKWNNAMLADDDFGFGSTATDVYDGYVDSMAGQKIKNMKNN